MGIKVNLQNREFIYGIQYWRPPTPLKEEWEADLRKIKSLGFNTIKIWLMWRWHERKRGKFNWEDTDKIFDLAEKYHLFINPNIMLETAPAWLYQLYNCYQVNNQGQRIIPGAYGFTYIGGVIPCFDNPKVREEANRFIKEAVKRYRDRKTLLGWDCWNEPRNRSQYRMHRQWPINNLECACYESKRKYREWLKNKFGTIGNLNNCFGKAWGDFEEIEPPSTLRDYAEVYLWRQWAMVSVSDMVSWVYKTVKFIDREHPAFAHIGAASVVQDVLNDTSNDRLNSRGLDFYGSSAAGDIKLYPFMPGLINSWIRNLSPYYWINEIYTNTSSWKEEVLPEDLRFWTWNSIASGAKGILYWQYKPERLGNESYGHGLVELDGKETERSKEISLIGKVLKENKKIFQDFKPEKRKIAILYDHRSDLISRIEEVEKSYPYSYKEALWGAYALFWRENLEVDWVDIQDLEKINNYPLLYLPSPTIIDKKEAEILKNYVKEGGFLISEASPGLREENTWVSPVVPGCGLDKVFGGKEIKRLVKKKKEEGEVYVPEYNLSLKASNTETILEPENGNAIGFWKESNQPAIIINRYGKGISILIGTYLGISYLHSAEENILKFLRIFADKAGIKPSLRMKGAKGFVSTRMLQKEKEKLIFLFNHENHKQNLIIQSLALVKKKDLILGQTIRETAGSIAFEIPAHQVVAILGR